MARRYWLFKSEPDVFSIDDLEQAPDKTTVWDGVRNYQARNFLRDEVQVGDGVLYYHSNASPSAVVGTASVTRAGYPDPTQFDPRSDYYDPASPRDNPRWYAVDVKYERAFAVPLPLELLRTLPALRGMVLLSRTRLSVQPVTPAEWKTIVALGTRGS